MEASALTHASRLGLLGRRSPLLRLQGDERLIAMIRSGQERAFEALFERYHARLLAFCRGMVGSSEDAEDVLQEVFVAAHKAILADNRAINARPWLYRIARNRCLNHLRKPVPEGQDSMDIHPAENGVSVADRVQKREEFRALVADVGLLPETQRTALLMREIDALAYEEIAVAMETTVPAVKSLLVRARMSLADCSQGRHLTCDEVHLELAEAAEGLRKASGPARAHMRSCDRCRDYRAELRRNGKALSALAPIGPLAALSGLLGGKLGLGGTKLGSGATAGGGGVAGTGTAVGTGGAAIGTGGAAVGGATAGGGGLALAGTAAAGGIGGALGGKAAAGVASVALLTAGAVEVNDLYRVDTVRAPAAAERTVAVAGPADRAQYHVASPPNRTPAATEAAPAADLAPVVPAPEAGTADEETVAPDEPAATDDAVAGGADSGVGFADSPDGGLPHTPPMPAPPPSDPAPGDPPPGEPPVVTPPADPPATPPADEPQISDPQTLGPTALGP